jgi:hypothetical protein
MNCLKWVTQWVHEWSNGGYKFQSSSGKTLMKIMAEKYNSFTGDPPKIIYKSLMDNLPSSPISSRDIRSQILSIVSDPSVVINASWEFTRNADPVTAERV